MAHLGSPSTAAGCWAGHPLPATLPCPPAECRTRLMARTVASPQCMYPPADAAHRMTPRERADAMLGKSYLWKTACMHRRHLGPCCGRALTQKKMLDAGRKGATMRPSATKLLQRRRLIASAACCAVLPETGAASPPAPAASTRLSTTRDINVSNCNRK